MSVQFQILSVLIPKSLNKEDTDAFFNLNNQLKNSGSSDHNDSHVKYDQFKRKIKDLQIFEIPYNNDIKLLCSLSHKNNKFKLQKAKQRGNCELAGRPKKNTECTRQHVETQQEPDSQKVE